MARQVLYPKFVDELDIETVEQENYRYSLSIPFKNTLGTKEKTLCVILKNPSVANVKKSDSTVCKVCNVAKNNGYTSVTILNLFPFRSTDAKKVVEFYQEEAFEKIMLHNLEMIKGLCKDKDVVFAWGTNTISSLKENKKIYDCAILDVMEVIMVIKSQTHYVDSCRCKNTCQNGEYKNIRYPLHGLRWSNTSKLIPY